ncbi:MAG TPA: hypothetical protein VHP11_03630, partial [Tepidisphaeraceae bacterium]|nr:hypothetical protein [Tepidisphaeraceae bacterium]
NEKAAAQFPRIGAQYALYTLTGKADRLASARALLKEAAGASAPSGDEPAQNTPAKVMPAFPMELEQGIIDRTKAASAPTTKPATAPADNAAPADSATPAPADNAAPANNPQQ